MKDIVFKSIVGINSLFEVQNCMPSKFLSLKTMSLGDEKE